MNKTTCANWFSLLVLLALLLLAYRESYSVDKPVTRSKTVSVYAVGLLEYRPTCSIYASPSGASFDCEW